MNTTIYQIVSGRPGARIFATLTLLFAAHLASAETRTSTWNPLEKQVAEPDTLFLLDVDAEQKLVPGDGGFLPHQPGEPPWTKLAPVEGKFRRGAKCIMAFGEHAHAFMWIPSIGLIAPEEFTVEAWFRGDQPWAEAEGGTLLGLADEHDYLRLFFNLHKGSFTLRFGHWQDARGPVRAELPYDFRAHTVAAGQWIHLAVTFKDGTLRLFVSGKLAGEQTGLRAPRVWSDCGRGDGLTLLGGGSGYGSPGFSISDLRISRRARTPGETIEVSEANTLTVRLDRPTGETVRQSLLGGLHTLTVPKTEELARGVLQVLRTDKLLTCTPIKAGAPDTAHPARGVSGKYSYDWQVVDRTFDYYQRLHITPYISIDSTPQILGGATPPFSGERLTTGRSFASQFTPELPNDFAAFGTLVRDLVHHVIIEQKHRVPYWGVWNEPNGGSFWNNKLDDYLRLYEVCAQAVKSVDSNLKIGGPETADFDRPWVEGLIKHCAEKRLPLDFVSWHYYLSTVGEIPAVRAQVDYWSQQYGLPASPELINGEWCWQIHNFPLTGYLPFRARNYYLNDWHAAFVASSLVEMQRAGVIYGIYTNPTAENGAGGFAATGLMSATHPWANLNVYRLWSKLAPRMVETHYDGRPGVFAQASRDDAGRVTILLAHLRYRKDASVPLTVELPGVTARRCITHYVVDGEHSNAVDAGPEHAELETVPPPNLANGKLTVILKPRSVHLLALDPGP